MWKWLKSRAKMGDARCWWGYVEAKKEARKSAREEEEAMKSTRKSTREEAGKSVREECEGGGLDG